MQTRSPQRTVPQPGATSFRWGKLPYLGVHPHSSEARVPARLTRPVCSDCVAAHLCHLHRPQVTPCFLPPSLPLSPSSSPSLLVRGHCVSQAGLESELSDPPVSASEVAVTMPCAMTHSAMLAFGYIRVAPASHPPSHFTIFILLLTSSISCICFYPNAPIINFPP